MSGFITDMWKGMTIFCGSSIHNGDDIGYEMKPVGTGKRIEYACIHPECTCAISSYVAEKILEKIMNDIIRAEENNEILHLKGYRFRYKTYDVRVVEQHESVLKLKVVDITQ